jgi:hypothetical protein
LYKELTFLSTFWIKQPQGSPADENSSTELFFDPRQGDLIELGSTLLSSESGLFVA